MQACTTRLFMTLLKHFDVCGLRMTMQLSQKPGGVPGGEVPLASRYIIYYMLNKPKDKSRSGIALFGQLLGRSTASTICDSTFHLPMYTVSPGRDVKSVPE